MGRLKHTKIHNEYEEPGQGWFHTAKAQVSEHCNPREELLAPLKILSEIPSKIYSC